VFDFLGVFSVLFFVVDFLGVFSSVVFIVVDFFGCSPRWSSLCLTS
jgi:hypothetical protein